jgi:hypothetical protein
LYRLRRFSLLEKSAGALTPLLLLLRKRSRSACLFGCKRPHDSTLSLPTFCGFFGFPVCTVRKKEGDSVKALAFL